MMFALFAAAAALSTPSSRDEAVKPVAAPVEGSSLSTAQADPQATRYCFLNVQEDHIMRGKVCKTRKQWMWHGIDPLNYLGRKK